MLFPEMIEKGKLRSLLTSEQLKTKDEELFVIRVPKSIEKSALRNFEFNVKSPERIKVDDKVFSPILDKDVKSKPVILANEKGKFGLNVAKVKGIITLRESVIVPRLPKLEIPPDSKVAPPPPLTTRHPIYGRNVAFKREMEQMEIKKEEEGEDQPAAKKKKKKKDKKKSKAE